MASVGLYGGLCVEASAWVGIIGFGGGGVNGGS